MSSKRDVSYRRYTIPENFIDSGRCLHGMFKTRGLVEGLILGGIAALIAFLFPIKEITTRIPVIICFAAPFFMLGVAGINGDPLSVFLLYAYTWFKTKGIVLYNGNTRFLDESPLDKMMEQTDVRDKIFDIIDKRRKEKEKENAGKRFIEGVDFEFGKDEDALAVVVNPEFSDEDEVEVVADSEVDIGLEFQNSSSEVEGKNEPDTPVEEEHDAQQKQVEEDDVVSMKLRYDIDKIIQEELF